MNCALPKGTKIDPKLNEVTKQVHDAYGNAHGYMVCVFSVAEDGKVHMNRHSGNWDKNKHHCALQAFIGDMLRVQIPDDLVNGKLVFDSYEDVLAYVEKQGGRNEPAAGGD